MRIDQKRVVPSPCFKLLNGGDFQLINLDKRHQTITQHLLQDPKITPHLPPKLALDHAISTFPISRSLAALARRQTLALGLLDKQHTLCAVIELNRVAKGRYELGYVVAPSHWRQGVGTYLLNLTIRFAKQVLGAQHFIAFTANTHRGQVPLLRRAGFVWLARQRYPDTRISQQWVDCYQR
jgi:RimJ/RimL family protein N-acetyltransferase